MTLESNIASLVTETTKLIAEINEERKALVAENTFYKALLGYDCFVSASLSIAGFKNLFKSFSELQEYIRKDRHSDKIVNVFVESFSDSLPIVINVPRIHIVFKSSVSINLAVGKRAFEVSSGGVIIQGGTYIYPQKDGAKQNKCAIGTSRENMVELRSLRIYRGDNFIDSDNVKECLDIINYD